MRKILVVCAIGLAGCTTDSNVSTRGTLARAGKENGDSISVISDGKTQLRLMRDTLANERHAVDFQERRESDRRVQELFGKCKTSNG